MVIPLVQSEGLVSSIRTTTRYGLGLAAVSVSSRLCIYRRLLRLVRRRAATRRSRNRFTFRSRSGSASSSRRGVRARCLLHLRPTRRAASPWRSPGWAGHLALANAAVRRGGPRFGLEDAPLGSHARTSTGCAPPRRSRERWGALGHLRKEWGVTRSMTLDDFPAHLLGDLWIFATLADFVPVFSFNRQLPGRTTASPALCSFRPAYRGTTQSGRVMAFAAAARGACVPRAAHRSPRTGSAVAARDADARLCAAAARGAAALGAASAACLPGPTPVLRSLARLHGRGRWSRKDRQRGPWSSTSE